MKSIVWEKIIEYIPKILPYFYISAGYVVLSFLIGTLLALLLAYFKIAGGRLVRRLAYAYTTAMRCVPSIVLLFLSYYGLIYAGKNLGLNFTGDNKFLYVVFTFSLFIAASMSEVIRSAYEAVEKGQWDAGVSIGLTPVMVLCEIIFPQAFRYALPNIGNSIIYLFKEGALAYTIGLIDMIGKGNQLIGTDRGHALEIYLALACIYWPLSIVLERAFGFLEKKFSKSYER